MIRSSTTLGWFFDLLRYFCQRDRKKSLLSQKISSHKSPVATSEVDHVREKPMDSPHGPRAFEITSLENAPLSKPMVFGTGLQNHPFGGFCWPILMMSWFCIQQNYWATDPSSDISPKFSQHLAGSGI